MCRYRRLPEVLFAVGREAEPEAKRSGSSSRPLYRCSLALLGDELGHVLVPEVYRLLR